MLNFNLQFVFQNTTTHLCNFLHTAFLRLSEHTLVVTPCYKAGILGHFGVAKIIKIIQPISIL